MAANGFGESDDEAKEVFTGIGVVEAAEIVGGLDDFGWDLEMVRRGDEWDLLGLWDRSEDYGLLGVIVWWDVDCGSADGAIGWWWGDFGPCRWWCSESGGAAAFTAS